MTAAALAAAGTVLSASVGLAALQRWRAASRARRRLGAGPRPRALPLPDPVRRAFRCAALADEADRLVTLWGLVVLLALVVSTGVPGARILVVVALFGGPGGLVLAGGRSERRRAAQLPEALDAVGAGLRGGLALPAAIAGAASVGAPLGDELTGIARAVDAGRPLSEAVGRWQAGATDANTALAGAALTVAASVGGPGARAVDGAAASLRDRIGNEAETAALATQGQASAAVLTLAPLAFALLLSSLDPAAGRFLLGTPVGWLCITVGLGLDAAGAWWMARLVRSAR